MVHVFGRDRQTGDLAQYLYNPATATWSFTRLAAPAGAALEGGPSAFLDSVRGAGVMITTNQGHLLVYYPGIAASPTDLTALTGVKVYSAVGVEQAGDTLYAYGTDQTGSLLEFAYPVSSGPAAITPAGVTRVIDASDPSYRKANDKDHPLAFQDVTVVTDGLIRHVFGADGNSRLYHVAIGPGGVITRENVTAQLTPDRVSGYSDYQLPFAGRVYSDVSAVIDPVTKDLYVYGTNGRDLIQFHKPVAGQWEVADLTNNVGAATTTGPANRVFGAPAAYVLADGSKHVLQIDEDGEVVEYYQLGRTSPFSTQNITLLQIALLGPRRMCRSRRRPPHRRPGTRPGSAQAPFPSLPSTRRAWSSPLKGCSNRRATARRSSSRRPGRAASRSGWPRSRTWSFNSACSINGVAGSPPAGAGPPSMWSRGGLTTCWSRGRPHDVHPGH